MSLIVDSSVLKQVFLQLSFKGNCKGEFRLKIACASRTGCYLVHYIKRGFHLTLISTPGTSFLPLSPPPPLPTSSLQFHLLLHTPPILSISSLFFQSSSSSRNPRNKTFRNVNITFFSNGPSAVRPFDPRFSSSQCFTVSFSFPFSSLIRSFQVHVCSPCFTVPFSFPCSSLIRSFCPFPHRLLSKCSFRSRSVIFPIFLLPPSLKSISASIASSFPLHAQTSYSTPCC